MAHILSLEAEADLDDIWLYVARDSGSIDIADRLIDSLTDRFGLLGRNPYIGRSRESNIRPNVRSFPVGKYVIFYRIDGENVLVLRVIHGSRVWFR